MSSALDLIITNGALAGSRIPLRTNKPLRLGRSSKAYQLVDSLASLSHAEITWEGDRYWLEDLDSVTGTYVNDERINAPVGLVPGMRVRIGETIIVVEVRRQSVVVAMARGIAVVIVLAALTYSAFSLITGIDVSYEPKVTWFEPVEQGHFSDANIAIPTDWIRVNGIDHRTLKVRRVTDFDGDGVDEIWLLVNGRESVITFGVDGAWEELAELPVGCTDRKVSLVGRVPEHCYNADGSVSLDRASECLRAEGGTLPEVRCEGVVYRYEHGDYHPVELEGVIVWMPPMEQVSNPSNPKEVWAERLDGPPVPHRVTLKNRSALAGFLSERGINEPVHYLICEGLDPNLPPQVLTKSGMVKPLAMGCINSMRLIGPSVNLEFANEVPQAYAFTGTGYNALMADMENLFAEGADPLFVNATGRAQLAALEKPPRHRIGAVKLEFRGSERLFAPVAPEDTLVPVRELIRHEVPTIAENIETTVIMESGNQVIHLPGCAELQITVADWHCLRRRACSSATEFLTIRNSGCIDGGPPVMVPYGGGRVQFRDRYVDTRVVVDSVSSGGQIDVLRARIATKLMVNDE